MKLYTAILSAAVAALLLFATSCATARGLTKLSTMTDAEYAAYTARAAEQVAIIAGAAIEEEDISAETVLAVATALRGMAESGTIVSVLGTLKLEGYAGAALVLGILELEDRFEQRGAYGEDGLLSERGLGVILAVAARLEATAAE